MQRISQCTPVLSQVPLYPSFLSYSLSHQINSVDQFFYYAAFGSSLVPYYVYLNPT